MTLVDPTGVADEWWPEQAREVAALALTTGEAPGDDHSRLLSGAVEAFVSLGGLVDVGAERQRLAAAIADATDTRDHAASKLANESFTARAPEAVVAKERAKLADAEDLLERLQAQLDDLG